MMGGFWPPELKHAGYDKVILRGKSPDLVYLWINNDKVEIRDASHLQGKGALQQFFEAVRVGYHMRRDADPERFATIDAGQSLEAVQADIAAVLAARVAAWQADTPKDVQP